MLANLRNSWQNVDQHFEIGESFPTSIYYLLAKFGFDTAENEPCKVCPLSAYRSLVRIIIIIITDPPGLRRGGKPRRVRGHLPGDLEHGRGRYR